MLRVFLPLFLTTVGVFLAVWLLGDATRALRARRDDRRRRAAVDRDRAKEADEADAVRRSRLSLLRAREARVVDEVTRLLREPDIDLLPRRQVAGLVVAIEEITEASAEPARSADGRPHPPTDTHESAVARAEALAESAAHDLRVARLAGGEPTG